MGVGISFFGIIIVFVVLGGGLFVVARLFGSGKSSSQEGGGHVAHGMTLSCPSCGRETPADRANCAHCSAEL